MLHRFVLGALLTYAMLCNFHKFLCAQWTAESKRSREEPSGLFVSNFSWNLHNFSPFSGRWIEEKWNFVMKKSLKKTIVCVLSRSSFAQPRKTWANLIYLWTKNDEKSRNSLFSIRQNCPRAARVCRSAAFTSATLIKLINFLIKAHWWWNAFNFPSSSLWTASRATRVRFDE